MNHPNKERCRGSILLAAASIWLIAVTLCSNRIMAEAPHDDEHDRDGHHSAPAGDHHEGGCGCESFSSFAPQSGALNLVKAPAPASVGPLFLVIWIDEIPMESAVLASLTQSTGPPDRISFAELVLQRCRHSHAPPLLT